MSHMNGMSPVKGYFEMPIEIFDTEASDEALCSLLIGGGGAIVIDR
jgi:hypothetical protein